MFDLSIDGVDALRNWAEADFKGRVLAIMRRSMRMIVERVYEDVVRAIPDVEPWLETYKKSLKIYEIDDLTEGEIGFAIASKVSADWATVDGRVMIVYFEPDPVSEAKDVGEILEAYSPFVVEQIPNLADYGARSVIRRVRESEVEEIRQLNEGRADRLRAALLDVDAAIRPGPAKMEGRVWFDLEFAVMRMELGFGDIRKPHWRPAIRRIGLQVSKMFRNANLRKKIVRYFDPMEVEWEKELRPKYPPIRLKEVERLESFQTWVRPNTL